MFSHMTHNSAAGSIGRIVNSRIHVFLNIINNYI